MNADVFVGLSDAWQEVRANTDIRVAVLTGAGDEDFCCGGDLGEMIPLWTGMKEPQNEVEQRVMDDPQIVGRIMFQDEMMPKPIIGAFNGRALGGGCEILQATDIRIAAEHAVFSVPEPKRGLVPGAGTMVRLARQISYANAMKMLLTAEPVTAQEAKEMGLISEVLPAGKLLERAEELADTVAANAPLSMQAIKTAVHESHTLDWNDAFAVERREAGLAEGEVATVATEAPTTAPAEEPTLSPTVSPTLAPTTVPVAEPTQASESTEPEPTAEPDPTAVPEPSGPIDITGITLVSTEASCDSYVGSYTSMITDTTNGSQFEGMLTISTDGNTCTFSSNQIPNHDTGEGSNFRSDIAEVDANLQVPATPQLTGSTSTLGMGASVIMLNGVKWEAYPAACFGVGNEAAGREAIGCGGDQIENPHRHLRCQEAESIGDSKNRHHHDGNHDAGQETVRGDHGGHRADADGGHNGWTHTVGDAPGPSADEDDRQRQECERQARVQRGSTTIVEHQRDHRLEYADDHESAAEAQQRASEGPQPQRVGEHHDQQRDGAEGNTDGHHLSTEASIGVLGEGDLCHEGREEAGGHNDAHAGSAEAQLVAQFAQHGHDAADGTGGYTHHDLKGEKVAAEPLWFGGTHR
ncbi:putative enoyl-CoA hydratase/isomerase YngF [Nymphon striatum]|nr:putative enoyl-CoA hydratase/isomerase YngF [Nymphon striatum]